MKKILLVVITLFMSVFLVGFNSYEASGNTPPPSQNQEAIWYKETGSNAYINVQYLSEKGWIRTNPSNYLTPIPNANFIWLYIYGSVDNPDPEYYNYLYAIELSGGKEITRFAAPVNTVAVGTADPISSDGEASNMYQSLAFYDEETNDEIYKISISNAGKQVKIYWTHIEETLISDFNDLPETDGNPLDNKGGDYGQVHYELDVSTHVASFRIVYEANVYRFTRTFEDISFLENTEQVLYYTEEDDRYMYLMYDTGDPLRYGGVANNDLASRWSGYSVWNMTQNDIVTYKKILTYTIVDQDDIGNLWAYFYTPTIAVDELLSATVMFEYRYHYVLGNPSAWISEARTLERDSKDIIDFRTWEEKLFAGIFTLGIHTFVYNISGLSTIASKTDGWALGYYDQIETVESPDSTLLNAYRDEYGVTVSLVNNTIQKLHLGQYRPMFATHVEMNYDTYKYTELVIRSNGRVFVFDEEAIITTPPAYVDVDGKEPFRWLLDLPFGEWIMTNFVAVIILLVLVIVYVFIFIKTIGSVIERSKDSLFFKILAIIMSLIMIGIFVGIILYILAAFGVI